MDINNLLSKSWTNKLYHNKIFTNIVSAIENFKYKLNSKKFTRSKNKILLVGAYNQFLYLIQELKKNPENIVIKGSIYPGRSIFRKDVDYFIRFRENEMDIKNKIKNIDLIVVTNTVVPFEKMLIKVAKELGIPTLFVQHGMLSGEDYIYRPINTTKIAVWGDITKNWLIKNGEDKDKIIIVGAPMLDKYITNKVNSEDVKKRFHIPSNKKVILFTAQPSLDFSKVYGIKGITPNKNTLEEEKETIRRLLKVTNKIGCFAIIKLHPIGAPDENEVLDYIKNDNFKDYLIFKKESIQDLISASDIVLTHHSTTGLEAFYSKKFMICLNFYNKFEPIGYAKHGCAIEATTEESLIRSINDIFYDKNVQKKLMSNSKKFIKLYSYKDDGKSSSRLAELILHMINKSKKEKGI